MGDVQAEARSLGLVEALSVVAREALDLPGEAVPLAAAVGRVLAEDALAGLDHPAVTSSSMDGFAIRAADAPGSMRVVGEVAAGAIPDLALAPGEAMRLGTGCALPAGADAVLRVEDADDRGDVVVTSVAVPPGTHVRPRASDLRSGDAVLGRGSVVGPHAVAALAAAGCVAPVCRREARVAILVTGPEIAATGAALAPGQIHDANGPGLTAQVEACGGRVVASAAVGDTRGATVEVLSSLLDVGPPPDLLLVAGGSSVGPHDVVPDALADIGATRIFHGIEMRPGHPTWFGRREETRILGLPGNPVSAAVCFHALGRGVLGRIDDWERRAPLAIDWAPSSPRAELVRCRWEAGALRPAPRQASYAVSSLAGADALAWLPAGGAPLRAGEAVRYSPL